MCEVTNGPKQLIKVVGSYDPLTTNSGCGIVKQSVTADSPMDGIRCQE